MAAPAVKVVRVGAVAAVEYEIVPMNRDAGDHRLPDFLARNPFGQVPVLEDGDLTLFESRAIARHVLRKHKPELLHGSPESAAAVDMWLEMEAHQHHEVTCAIVVNCIISPLLGCARDQAVVDKRVTKLCGVLELYEARLSASRYLAGDSVSLADLSHFLLMRHFMETEYASLVDVRVSKDLSKSSPGGRERTQGARWFAWPRT